MLRYNWQKIFDAAKGKPSECLRIVRMLTYKELPKNRYDPIYQYSKLNFRGESFLLYPEVMFCYAFRHTKRDLCIYLSYASLRPYSEYRLRGKVSLPLYFVPKHPEQQLKSKELLTVKSGEIHFLYEQPPSDEAKHFALSNRKG
jgi:hypothetical protein